MLAMANPSAVRERNRSVVLGESIACGMVRSCAACPSLASPGRVGNARPVVRRAVDPCRRIDRLPRGFQAFKQATFAT